MKYLLTQSEFVNTGGNCMVLFNTYYSYQDIPKTLFVAITDDYYTVSTVTMQFENEEQEEYFNSNREKYIIAEGSLVTDRDFLEMQFSTYAKIIDDSWLAFIRHTCARFKTVEHLTFCQLPDALINVFDHKFAIWLEVNDQLVTTDGFKVWNDFYKD